MTSSKNSTEGSS